MITLTESAASRVQVLLASQKMESEAAGLRVFVKAGGCAGFEYGFDLEDVKKDNDYVFDMHGVRVYLDPKSALYLAGTEIDYEETLMATGFKVNNPNAESTCGCGTSFSV